LSAVTEAAKAPIDCWPRPAKPMNMLLATAEAVSSTLRRPFDTLRLSIFAYGS
jgi:hypothetical protein